jgi:hypothetical protein
MNIVEYNNNTTNDDGANNEGKSYIVSDIYMILNIVRYLKCTICKEKFKI